MLRLALALVFGLPLPLAAEEMVTYETNQPFDDVVFNVENAILNAGLVADNVSHVGEMLERTRDDVGSDVVLFEAAEVFSFCSAVVSREMMEADPLNIGYCPYDIFVMQLAEEDTVTVGYRPMPEGEMQKVEALLDTIARAATGE